MKFIFPQFILLLFYQFGFGQQNVFPYKFHDKYGIVDEEHNKITEPIFDYIQLFCNQKYNHYTQFSQNDANGKPLFGIIDQKGKIIVPASYTDLTYDGNGLYYFVRDADTIQIKQVSNNKIIAKAQPWTIQSYNSL
ncbi:MAG TPA: WG repeat-containing protein, partial [Saprospiraceae bacterium]|nr:WG repeat-containing protein [Saprospiraceae bacterium]